MRQSRISFSRLSLARSSRAIFFTSISCVLLSVGSGSGKDVEDRKFLFGNKHEEELTIFDILTKPEPTLSKTQEIEVKKIARELLAKLRREKLILDWRTKEMAKAAVRETIREELDALPEVYERRLWEEKVERTYQFVFEHYEGVATALAL